MNVPSLQTVQTASQYGEREVSVGFSNCDSLVTGFTASSGRLAGFWFGGRPAAALGAARLDSALAFQLRLTGWRRRSESRRVRRSVCFSLSTCAQLQPHSQSVRLAGRRNLTFTLLILASLTSSSCG